MWFAIMVTVLAASGNNIGKVLQKQATRTLPRLTLKREVIEQYLASKTWTAGMLTDLGGALLMIVAFANAPVSVVQPVSAVGLVVLLIFSHFYLKERLMPHEWAAAGVAGIGVLGLGASAEPGHLDHPAAPAAKIVLSFLGLVALLVGEVWWRHWSAQHHKSASGGGVTTGGGALTLSGSGPGTTSQALQSSAAAAAASDAAMCGLEAGTCFGLSAAACRTGFVLARKLSVLCIPMGLGCSVALTTSGFVLQTRGLKAGNTIIVCTLAAVASMVSGVVAGLVALEEKMPSGHGMKLVRLSSWVCILLGVTSLAGGRKGAATLARLLSSWLPPPHSRVWRYLPRQLALHLHRIQKNATMMSDSLPGGGDDDDRQQPQEDRDVEGGGGDRISAGEAMALMHHPESTAAAAPAEPGGTSGGALAGTSVFDSGGIHVAASSSSGYGGQQSYSFRHSSSSGVVGSGSNAY